MDVYSGYPVRHKLLLLAGAESVPSIPLSRVTGYRRSHRETTTPNYSLNTHAPDQTSYRPRLIH